MMPTPSAVLVRVLVFISGALAARTLVRAALTARQAREEPRGGGGNSTGNNGIRNETQHRPQLLPPSLQSMERDNPCGSFRDLEDARVEGGENGGRGGEKRNGNIGILIVILMTRAIITLMMIFKIRSEAKITAFLELSLCFAVISYFLFGSRS